MADPVLSVAVRNFLGVRTADLPLKGINLVCGRNGAGKSSLLEGVACAVLQTARVRGITTKKAAAAVVRHGAEEGVVALANSGSPVLRVRFPTAEIEQLGAPLPPITMAASGLGSFIDMPADRRMAEIIERFQARPSRQDLYDFLAQQEGTAGLVQIIVRDATDTELERTRLDDATDAMFARVEENGWDAVYRSAREATLKLKGQWEQVTGRKWGSKVAREFLPPLLVPGEEYSLPTHDENVARAKARLENLIAAGGVADHERTLLKEQADRLPTLQAELAEIEAKGVAADALLRKSVAEQAKPQAAIDVKALIQCPNCGKHIREVKASGVASPGAYTTFECVELPSEDQREAQAAQARALAAEIRDARAAIEENARQASAKRMEIKAAEQARNQIAASEGKPVKDEEAINAQRHVVQAAEAMRDAIKQHQDAHRIQRNIVGNQAFVDALEPSGVRMAVLRRKIDALNTELARISSLAKFETVRVETEEADLDVYYGDRMAKLASKSERWRVEMVFAVVFAMREGSPLVMLDEFDIINNDDRAPIISALHQLGINAVICMTAKSRDKDVPDLGKFKLGATWWMEAGALSPLAG